MRVYRLRHAPLDYLRQRYRRVACRRLDGRGSVQVVYWCGQRSSRRFCPRGWEPPAFVAQLIVGLVVGPLFLGLLYLLRLLGL